MPTDEQFRLLVLDAPDVVAILEADLTVRFVCRSVRRLLGFSSEELADSNLREYLDPGEADRVLFEFKRKSGRGTEDALKTFEVRLRHKDGSWRRFDATVIDRLEEPVFRGMALYLRDVTERRAQEEQLVHQALHDPLTGLANRALFVDRLSRALGATAREREPVAVLFIDLDDFKAVNDSLGHAAGDRLLVALGQRVRACLRPGDTVARFGGDEFAVLLEETAREAETVAARIRETLHEPLNLEGEVIRVSASVGIAISDGMLSNDGPEDLLRSADASMYRAKKDKARRGSRYGFEAVKGRVRHGLEDRLRRAVKREELSLYYLAAATPDTRRIACMEALLRWEDPEIGVLSPQEIIGLAERSDIMAPLGRWILGEACNQALLWHEMWPNGPPLVSVNLSANQFQQDSLFGAVGTTLREIGLDPDALVLEIAEESLMHGNAEGVVERLCRLRNLGVKLAIDDFAPGNPELPNLRRLPVDFVKLERSLVKGLGRGRKNAGLLAQLYTGLAQSQGIGVVAEGVESIEQLEALEQMECDLVQGFYLWRPLPGPEATELLRANLGAP